MVNCYLLGVSGLVSALESAMEQLLSATRVNSLGRWSAYNLAGSGES